MLKDLTIFQKAYDFLKWIHVLIKKFPKSEKFVLAQRMENASLDLLEAIIKANKSHDKIVDVDNADLALEKMRIWFRLAFELNFVSLRQYEIGSKMINEIGRLLGGWKKRFCSTKVAGL